MYRIYLRNQCAQIMASRQNHRVFIGDLILYGRILKPLTAIGTFVVQNITLLTAGGLYGFNTIQRMFVFLVFRFFTIAAICAGLFAHHTRLYANIALFTLRTPTAGAILADIFTIGTQIHAIAASAAIHADQLGAITADRSAIRTHIYAIIAGVTLFAPSFCAISADLFTIGAKLYTVAAGFTFFAPDIETIHAAVAVCAPLIGAIFANFFAVLAKIHAVGAKLAAFTPGIGASVADRSAIFTDFSAIAAKAALFAPAIGAIDTDLTAGLANFRTFVAGLFTACADIAVDAILTSVAAITFRIHAASTLTALRTHFFFHAFFADMTFGAGMLIGTGSAPTALATDRVFVGAIFANAIITIAATAATAV
jgi:hypothetical protein